MPNWCSNKLTIEAKAKDREELEKFLKTSFKPDIFIPEEGITYYREKFMGLSPEEKARWGVHGESPTPSDLNTAAYSYWFNEFGYNWRIANWGTKWEWDIENTPEIEYISNDRIQAEMLFSTAWSPPIPVVQSASTAFPSLVFILYYEEPGMNFSGEVTFQAGETLSEWEGECPIYEEEDDE